MNQSLRDNLNMAKMINAAGGFGFDAKAARSKILTAVIGLLIISSLCNALEIKTVSAESLSSQSPIEARLVTDEAEAVLTILAKKRANRPITEADWQSLFASEGYVRLKKREAAMGRSFEDADFKSFVLSDDLSGRAQALTETLDKWKRTDVTKAARLAMAYLPGNARIKAKIYPVIKPRGNSFVFDIPADPAIFLYLDPARSKDKFENTLTHELHHIGYGSSCPSTLVSEEISRLPQKAQNLDRWLGAFGEGFAMQAAAGGADIHPHSVSDPDERARWDRDMMNFNDDLKKVEKFFLDIWENRLTDQEKIAEAGFSFFGEQGPWYTVGWRMAVLIEKTYGREKLIEVFCDKRNLLETYNEAAALYNGKAPARLALWSDALTKALSQGR